MEKEITIIIDVDYVISKPLDSVDYSKSIPYKSAIEAINKLYDAGYIIKLFTARYMKRCNGDKLEAFLRGYNELKDWLFKNKVKYHELHFGKLSGDIYIDDKAYRLNSETGEGSWDEVIDIILKEKYKKEV